MYPLLSIGPFSLSTGGLLLLVSVLVASLLASRIATQRVGVAFTRQVDDVFLPVALGMLIGGRLWYGLLNWDLYGRAPALFAALRIADLAWPGGLLGGALVGWLWARMRSYDLGALADTTALTLPAVHLIASFGLLLSGEALGVATDLPWGITMFGAVRHPTQIYYALAAVVTWVVLHRLSQRNMAVGMIAICYLGLHGLTLLLIESLRADSLLLPGGVRATQLFGLFSLVLALTVARQQQIGSGQGRSTGAALATTRPLQEP